MVLNIKTLHMVVNYYKRKIEKQIYVNMSTGWKVIHACVVINKLFTKQK
jgi:hypothetical protein